MLVFDREQRRRVDRYRRSVDFEANTNEIAYYISAVNYYPDADLWDFFHA